MARNESYERHDERGKAEGALFGEEKRKRSGCAMVVGRALWMMKRLDTHIFDLHIFLIWPSGVHVSTFPHHTIPYHTIPYVSDSAMMVVPYL